MIDKNTERIATERIADLANERNILNAALIKAQCYIAELEAVLKAAQITKEEDLYWQAGSSFYLHKASIDCGFPDEEGEEGEGRLPSVEE